MRTSWKQPVIGMAAASGAVLLSAALFAGTVGAQSPSPSPAAATPMAQPATPPLRVYGTVNAPAGTTVTATIGTVTCGSASVSPTGTYVLDVAASSGQAGCGTDGATVNFSVGSTRTTQTATWRQGGFIELNLTAQAATATPAATATATPTPRPATATATATPRPSPTVTATPATSPRPSASPAPQAQKPAGTPAAQKPSGAPVAAAPPAQRVEAPVALPSTGTGGMQADSSMTAGSMLGGLSLAFGALGLAGVTAYRRVKSDE